jgi:hypothetical protein
LISASAAAVTQSSTSAATSRAGCGRAGEAGRVVESALHLAGGRRRVEQQEPPDAAAWAASRSAAVGNTRTSTVAAVDQPG